MTFDGSGTMGATEERHGTVFVAGGTRGIGFATAAVMGAAGWSVAITGTGEDTVRRASAELSDRGIRHHALRLAVEEEGAWEPALEEAESALGPITALVCSAGISPKRDGRKIPFEEADTAVWRRTLDVNLMGTLHGLRAVTPRMKRRGGGSVVAVSSLAARVALALTGSYYTTSKAAIGGLVRAAAGELGPHGIRVNGVLPGRIDTDMTREAGADFNQSLTGQIALRRIGRPEEVAEAIAFLCGAKASYITGVNLDVGGGWCIG